MELTMTHMVTVTVLGFIVTIATIIYNKGEWKGTVNATLKELAQKIEALTKRVDKIYEVFFERAFGKTLESHSPLKLNELGREIADKLSLDSLADTHTLFLKAKAANLGPYEIQQLCFRYAQEDLVNELLEKSPEQFEAISLMAFNKGIPREDVLKIVGVLLRDRILKMMGYSDEDHK